MSFLNFRINKMGFSEETISSEFNENEKDENYEEIRHCLMNSQFNSNLNLKKKIEKLSSTVSSIITLRFDHLKVIFLNRF